jgi:3-dehydroquinate synthase
MNLLTIKDPCGGDESICDVVVGHGQVAGALPEVILPARGNRTAVAILAQPATVEDAARLADEIESSGLAAAVRVVPDREAAKSISEVERLYLWLNELQIARGDTLLAIGGGAVTDVGGFVAGTYLRGIEAVYVPTTLLGAVDASIGGKTGINVAGKNLAGVFKHPRRVVIDVDVLEGLPEDLRREGAAEAVKAGFIADPEIVRLYEEHGLDVPLEEIVHRAAKVKVDVVNEDFTEQGTRAILNYGHTIGHAIEVAGGLSHGHAIAVGMVAAGAAAERMFGFGGSSRQQRLLDQLGLPTAAPGLDREQVESLIALDKKRDATGVRMVLLRDFGVPEVVTVDTATVDAALAAVGVV